MPIRATSRYSALMLILAAGHATAQNVSVGSDAACDTTDLNAAITMAIQTQAKVIKVANNQTYTGIAATIDYAGGELTIQGGYSACDSADFTSTTTLSGSGASGPVLSILNGFVYVQGLVLRDGTGGGLYASGTFTSTTYSTGVFLVDSTVTANHSPGDGGGIHIESAYFYADGSIVIDHNSAASNGGGVYANNSFLYFNDEEEIYTATGGIAFNQAGGSGGGMYLDNTTSVINDEFLFANQAALNGGAIDVQGGSLVYGTTSYCAIGHVCALMVDNGTTNGGFAGAIYARNADVDVTRAILAANYGTFAGAVYALGTGQHLNMTSVLVDVSSAQPLAASGSAAVIVDSGITGTLIYDTFGGNAGVDESLLDGGSLTVLSSVIADATPFALANGYTQFGFDCAVFRPTQINWLAYGSRSFEVTDFGFYNEASGDFRLTANSVGTDYCDDSVYGTKVNTDVLGNVRGIDVASKPNLYGPIDIGAYESIDDVFSNGFN